MVTFYSVILLGVACAWGGIYSAGIFVRNACSRDGRFYVNDREWIRELDVNAFFGVKCLEDWGKGHSACSRLQNRYFGGRMRTVCEDVAE